MKLVAYFLIKFITFPIKVLEVFIKCKFTSFTGGFALVPCLHLWYNTSMCNRPYFMLLYLFHCLKVWFDFHVHIFVYIFVWKILTNSTIKRTYEICLCWHLLYRYHSYIYAPKDVKIYRLIYFGFVFKSNLAFHYQYMYMESQVFATIKCFLWC